jgi:hypothetical protein
LFQIARGLERARLERELAELKFQRASPGQIQQIQQIIEKDYKFTQPLRGAGTGIIEIDGKRYFFSRTTPEAKVRQMLGIGFERAKFYVLDPRLATEVPLQEVPIADALADPYQPVTKNEFFTLTEYELRQELARAISRNKFERDPERHLLDTAQGVLDLAGMIPVVGDTLDIVNGLIYLARGRPLEAGISQAAMLPIFGSLSPVAKRVVQLSRELEHVEDSARFLRELCDLAQQAGRHQQHLPGLRSQLELLEQQAQALRQAVGPLQPAVARFGKNIDSYDNLKDAVSGSGLQRHHLNQVAVYGAVIPKGEGVAVLMDGDVIRRTGIGKPHRKFHESMEAFWDQFRENGARYLEKPTNGEYGAALEKALRDAGYLADEAAYLALEARLQRLAYGLKETDEIPSAIPKPIYP